MSLFKRKFKKVEAQNVETLPEADAPVTLPSLAPIYPQQIQPLPIQVAQAPQIQQVPQEITHHHIPNIDERIAKKVEELKIKRLVIEQVIEILEGI